MARRGWRSRSVRPLALKSQEPSLFLAGGRGVRRGAEPPAPGALLALRAGLRLPRPLRAPSRVGRVCLPPRSLPASSSSSPNGVSAPSSPRGGVGGSRESGLSAAALPPLRLRGCREVWLPEALTCFPSSPPPLPAPRLSWFLPPPSTARVRRGRAGESWQVGRHHGARIWGEDLRAPPPCTGEDEGWAEKVTHLAASSPRVTEERAVLGETGKSPALVSPLSKTPVTLGLAGVTTLAGPGRPSFSPPHPTPTQGSQRQPLLPSSPHLPFNSLTALPGVLPSGFLHQAGLLPQALS